MRFEPYVVGPVFISPINVVAAAIAILFLIGFGLFFTRSRLGVAMRAVADDQQAAMVVGIRVPRVFALSWAIAGLAAAAGGIIWGNMLGVDTFLALVGLKVFPSLFSVVWTVLAAPLLAASSWERSRAWRQGTWTRMWEGDEGFHPVCIDDPGVVCQTLRLLRPRDH